MDVLLQALTWTSCALLAWEAVRASNAKRSVFGAVCAVLALQHALSERVRFSFDPLVEGCVLLAVFFVLLDKSVVFVLMLAPVLWFKSSLFAAPLLLFWLLISLQSRHGTTTMVVDEFSHFSNVFRDRVAALDPLVSEERTRSVLAKAFAALGPKTRIAFSVFQNGGSSNAWLLPFLTGFVGISFVPRAAQVWLFPLTYALIFVLQ